MNAHTFGHTSDWCEYAEIEYQQLLLSEQGDMICDDDDENDDIGSFEDEDEESSQLEEACSTSDHDSDTSAPTTPTKDPITGASLQPWKQDSVSNTSSNTTMVQPSTNTSEQQQSQDPTTAQVWLWQPNTTKVGTAVNDEIENEEQGQDRAAEWVWLISSSRQQHHQHMTNPPP